jgi:two-component system chemotaxis response regulator CheY
MRALVVEDSRPTRAIMRQFLETIGFEVHEAGDGRAGLDTLARIGAVDVALIDWNMPVMDGCELVRRMRALDDHRRTAIMMVTTENQLEQVSIALEAGADEFLMKPFDQQALQEKLALMGFEPGRDVA